MSVPDVMPAPGILDDEVTMLDYPDTRDTDELDRAIAWLEGQLRAANELNAELVRNNARLIELCTTDDLTGLKNRRHFRESLSSAFAFAARHRLPLSVIMLDVDDFKSYNDTFGHQSGDIVLGQIADLIRGNLRSHDLVARYGGEEFVILLPATGYRESLVVAERIRGAIADHPWPQRPITASLGIATMTGATRQGGDLVGEADRALFQSKRMGKNRITHHRALA